MKKKIQLLLAICISALLSACGTKLPEEPGKDKLEADVQEYIQELIDPAAKIQYLQKSDSEMEEKELSVVCVVSYSSEETAYQDEFLLTYEVVDKSWELSKCRVNSEYSEKRKESLIEASENGTEEVTEMMEEETREEEPEKTTSQDPGDVSENIEDFMFELEGVVYQLPVLYSEMKENGWVLDPRDDESEEDEILANGYDYYRITNGIVSLDVEIINLSGDIKVLEECAIGAIAVTAKNNLDFVIAKGITCLSTVDEVQEAFGIPSSSNSGDGYKSLKYTIDNYQSIRFYFDEKHSYNNSIELECYKVTEHDVTEISDEVPEYLSAYEAPEALSENVTDTVFELDGALYQLPCTLSAFIDNGWSIVSSEQESLGAGNKQSYCLTIEKDDNKVSLGLLNLSKKAAYVQNCAVYQVDFQSYSLKNAPDGFVKLSGGLKWGSSLEEVEEKCSEFVKTESSNGSSVSYRYEDSAYTKQIRYYVYFGSANDDVTITLSNLNWNY